MGLGSGQNTIDFISQVALGLLPNYSVYTKKGQNPAVSNGSLPIDLWSQNSLYTGFDVTAAIGVLAVSSDATDTGELTVSGLLTSSSTEYTSETITLSGTTPVTFTNQYYRIHTARYSSGSADTFNVGNIDVYNEADPTELFLQILAGKSQSYMGGFTIPAGSTGLIYNVKAQVKDGASAVNGDGSFWVRPYQGSPRLRRPIVVSSLYESKDLEYAPIVLQEKTDVIPRIISLSNNNLFITISYNVLTKKN